MKNTSQYKIIISLIVICNLCFGAYVYAAGTESADFLNIGVGAKPVGMGNAYTAAADDVHSIYWNPAGLGIISNHQFTFTHNEAFEGIRQEYLAYAGKIESIGTLGIGITYLTTGNLIGRNVAGHLTSDFSSHDLAINLGYGRELIEKLLYVGANIKYISEVIENEKASAFAFDIGTIIKPIENVPLTIGIVAQNIGTKMKFVSDEETLPFTYKFGAAYKLFDKNLTIAVDLVKPNKDPFYVNLGGEYCFMDLVSVRIGYSFDTKLDKNLGLSLGGGIKYQSFILDYAYVPFGDLGVAHRISFGVGF